MLKTESQSSVELVIYAPVAGQVIEMAQVPDLVFAKGIMGDGCGILPTTDTVYAPISGTITTAMSHAVLIHGTSGAEVLVHVGIDTVNLQEGGFNSLCHKGDKVELGQRLIEFDRMLIKEAGYSDCVVVAISNSAETSSIQLSVEPGVTVSAGSKLLTLD